MKKFVKLSKGGSVVDVLNAAGKSSSFNDRKRIAESMGIKNYTGSAEQNSYMSDVLYNEYAGNKSFNSNLDRIEKPSPVSKSQEPSEGTKYKPVPHRSAYRPKETKMVEPVEGFSPIFMKSGEVRGNSKYLQKTNTVDNKMQELESQGFRFAPKVKEKEAKTYNWYERNVRNPLENKGVNMDAIETGTEAATYLASGLGLAKSIASAPKLAKELLNIKKVTNIGRKFVKDAMTNNPSSNSIKTFNKLPSRVKDIAKKLEKAEIPDVSPERSRATIDAYNAAKEIAEEANVITKMGKKQFKRLTKTKGEQGKLF